MAEIYLDSIEVCRRLSAACKAAGSQKAWAEKHGVSPAYVSDVINALRPPGQSILDALGLVRVVRYRAKSATAPKGKKEEGA
jgi:hypothetical protein